VWMCSIPFIHFSFQSSFIIEIKLAKFIQVAALNYMVVLVFVQYYARSWYCVSMQRKYSHFYFLLSMSVLDIYH